MEPSEKLNRLASVVVDSALTVHRTLGPGLLESIYESCLEAELQARDIRLARQVSVPITYRDRRLDAGFRLDFVVEDELILEIKAVERLLPVHEAQLLTYLKLSQRHLGLLINFNVPMIKDGIRRLVHTP